MRRETLLTHRQQNAQDQRRCLPARAGATAAVALTVAVLLGLGLVYALRRRTPPVRGVLLISIDTCRADHLGCYGFPAPTTPHIDALAEESVLFENAISPCPLTLPAHCSMLTGAIPPRHGARDNLHYQLAPRNVTLAEILRGQGFTTAAVIGAFVLESQFGLSQGFDTYDERFEKEDVAPDIAERRGAEVSRHAVEWLESHQDERFFMFLHYYDPHTPYEPPEPFAARFAADPYAGEIAYADHCIGQVIERLKALGLYDSALILVTSDHGEMLGEHGEEEHGYFIYEGAVKVPLICRLPGAAVRGRVRARVGLVDIVPTLCSLLGLPAPAGVQGEDVTLRFPGQGVKTAGRGIYCESLTPSKYGAASLLGLVADRWKYVHTVRPELYDLSLDPGESNDLVAEQPERARAMEEQLRGILEGSRDAAQTGRTTVSRDAAARLRSLGYAGGQVREDVDPFHEQSGDDPKDLVAFHVSNQKISYLLSRGNREAARALCEKMIEERPSFLEGHIHMADFAMEQGDYAGAVRHLTQALALEPEHPAVHSKLGTSLLSLGQTDRAVLHYRRTLEVRPDQPEAHNNLGIALKARGDAAAAARYYREALAIRPDYAEAHNHLGLALESLGQQDEAMAHYRQAVKADPGLAAAHNNLASVLAAQGKWSEAIAGFRRALEEKPNYARAHYNLGLAFQMQGRGEAASACYRRALELDPRYVEAHTNLGVLLQSQGRVQEAIGHYRRALDIAPDYAPALKNLRTALDS